MANKMADKKKNASQDQMVAPKPKARGEDEQGKAVKAVTRERGERKVQETKSVRRESKSPSATQVRLRNNRFVRFVLEAYYELRHKVTWPSFEEARNMTMAVILLSAAVGALLGIVDFGLFKLFQLLSAR